MNRSGKLGATEYEISIDTDGNAVARAWRDYPAGTPTSTSQRVWQIIADFGAIKTIFPSVLSVYVTYPDATDAAINTVRHMTFAPQDRPTSLSLPTGVEQLVELNEEARQLTYISPLGLPVRNYRSIMKVDGADACRLTWTSSFVVDAQNEDIAGTVALILAGGAEQIAKVLT